MADPSAADILRFHLEAGVDETIGESPVDRFASAERAAAEPAPEKPPPPARRAPRDAPRAAAGEAPAPPNGGRVSQAVQAAWSLAAEANSVAELKAAVEGFEGCGLKKTATNTVFADGNPEARLMFVGEAPGAEEDRQGLPFVGPSGRLLDRMLETIGYDREKFYVTNIVFWRPPGNRNPTTDEIAACLPFLERHIELAAPDVLVPLGGPAAKTLLGRAEGITKLRGSWHSYSTAHMSAPVDTMASFHPAYLLRSPANKRQAWRDLLEIRQKLDGAAAKSPSPSYG